MHEVRRSVERVEDPSAFAGLTGRAGLLGEESEVGAGLFQHPQGGRLGFEVGIGITSSNLTARVEVDGEIPDEKLREAAERAKILCPVSKALAGIEVTLDLPDLAPVVDEDEEAAVDAEAAVDDEAGVETED